MRQLGFTLVEVMVAMAVVAIALPALLMALYQQMDDTAYLRDKTLAQMVAANQLAEFRLAVRAREELAPGKASGQSRMADRDWFWWSETKTTEVEQFYRVEIKVAAEENRQEHPLYQLVAFMSGDLELDLSQPDPGEQSGEQSGDQSGDQLGDGDGGAAGASGEANDGGLPAELGNAPEVEFGSRDDGT